MEYMGNACHGNLYTNTERKKATSLFMI